MGDIEKLKEILEDHEKRISKLEKKKSSVSVKEDTDNDTVQALNDLLKGSFFNEPKKYGQIIKQLKTNATFLAKTNYKKGLESLVKAKKLSRKQVEHQWMYSKNG